MKQHYDLGNLLCMFDESLEKIVTHLVKGYPDRALLRTKEMQKVIDKLKKHCCGAYGNGVEKKL